MFTFQSIKFRLIGLGTLLVLAAVLWCLFAAPPAARELLRDMMASQQLSMASYVARDIDHSVEARRALIKELASSLPPALLEQQGNLAQWVRDKQSVNRLFDGALIVLAPRHGALLAQYPLFAGRDKLPHATSDWYQAAQQARQPVMSSPQRLNGLPVLIIAMPVRDPAGRVVAVLAGLTILNGPGFLDRLQEARSGASGDFLLISPADKLFVSASDPAMTLTPTPAPGRNLLHDRAMQGYRGIGVTTNIHGREELAAIVSVPSTGWFLVARIPTEHVFYPVEMMRGFLLKNTALIIVGMIATLLLLLPRILRPLTDAAHSMREMADGRRELAPLPVARRDEVGTLVAGFNDLVLRLREKDAALKASEERLEFIAHHDALTGLYARSMLEDRVQQAFARAVRHGAHCAILFCDLDDFKPINDQFGHAAGDAVLRQVAQRLLLGRRQTDTVARIGGDEFVILLTDLQHPHRTARIVAQQLLTQIKEPFEFDGRIITLGASVGIALYGAASTSGAELMSQADNAMYQAKRAGKNQFHFFDPAPEP
jgi:diguanylate cyclase (GGDEF)-like protein